MSSKRTNKSKESTDENNIKQIIEMNLQLSNQMVGLKKKLSEAEADKTAIKNRCNQQSAECAKKDKEIKNLKIHLEKLESERFRNDLVVLDEGKQIQQTGDIADAVIQSVEELTGIDWHQQMA